jgi:hypothetical protein
MGTRLQDSVVGIEVSLRAGRHEDVSCSGVTDRRILDLGTS